MSSALLDGIRRRTRRVEFRLVLWHSGIFIAASAIVLATAYWLILQAFLRRNITSIENRAHQLAGLYEKHGVETMIDMLHVRQGRATNPYFVRLVNQQGVTTYLRDAADWTEFDPDSLPAEVPEEPEARVWRTVASPRKLHLHYLSERLADGVTLQVGKTDEDAAEVLQQFRKYAMGLMVLVVPASFGTGLLVAHRALRPIQKLGDAVETILETGKFDRRVPSPGTGDELDELIGCFNAMLEKISGLLQAMRESLDNVAHDLRTPMTRLRNIAQRAIETEQDPARLREALADGVEESERVLTLLNTLMDISEAEAGLAKMERKQVSLQTLAASVIELYEHVAEEKRIEVTSSVPEWAQVSGDAGRLRRALANLVDNALKYTEPGGRVCISTQWSGPAISLTVADTGQGIDAADLPRLWERLYRSDKSRSARGLGLGLSFVKAIAEAHGGSVSAESRPGGGSEFSMRLPV